MKTQTFLVLLLLMIAGCGKEDVTSQNVEFITIAQGALYGNGAENIPKQNIVITSQKDFDNLVKAMNSVNNTSSSFTEMTIDFSKFQVIAVFDEVKMYGKATTSIDKIIEKEQFIEIFVDTSATGLLPVMNQPYHIIKTKRTEKKIIFKIN